MSVIVKGMDMPSFCEECPCCYLTEGAYSDKCQATGKSIEEFDYDKFKPDWCPLVEIPEKHGRLIDGDKLIKDLATMWYDGKITITGVSVSELVREQETVIESEEWKCHIVIYAHTKKYAELNNDDVISVYTIKKNLLEQKSVSPAAFYGNIVFDEDKMRKIVDKKVSEITLEYEQAIIDKINALQTYKLAEGDANMLVSRDDVINILKGE